MYIGTMQKKQFLDREQLLLLFGEREIETILKRRAGRSLTQTERNYLSASIRPKLRAIHAIEQFHLLPEINHRKEHISRQDIIFNLSSCGYELITPYASGKGKKIPLEELIMHILLQYPEARFIEAIPLLLLKQEIDPFKLLELATCFQMKNQLGFLLETALSLSKPISKKEELQNLLRYLRKNKEKEQHLLGEDFGKEYKEFLTKSSSPRMASWHLLGRFFDEDFKMMARTYS